MSLPGQSSLFEEDPMLAALRAQARVCGPLGSKMYETLFTELADDYKREAVSMPSLQVEAVAQSTMPFL
jgi:hypothetical protein